MILVSVTMPTEIIAYHLNTSTENYVYQDNLPKLDELTVCLWVQGMDSDDDGLRAEALLSFSTRENLHSLHHPKMGSNSQILLP